MGCAWFGPRNLTEERKKQSHERRSLTWRATGVVTLREEDLANIPKVAYEQGPLVKALDASHNKLEALDDHISFLSKLQRLTLSNNRLSLLNDRIVQLSKLRVLVSSSSSQKKKAKRNPLNHSRGKVYILAKLLTTIWWFFLFISPCALPFGRF